MKNVIPAEAGIQFHLNKKLSLPWFPAYAGTSLDSCFRRNDVVEILDSCYLPAQVQASQE